MVFLLAVEQTFNSTSIINLPFNLPLPIAIILGHEIKGVDDKILEMVNIAVEIPQWGTKHSLNVSVAAGITMWEVVKRNIDKIDTVESK
jgi:tRNA G18 (ribose-2'-O)-methylase SpoU